MTQPDGAATTGSGASPAEPTRDSAWQAVRRTGSHIPDTGRFALLSGGSFAAGVLEAIVLVLLAGAAVAATSDESSVDAFGHDLSLTAALVAAAGLLAAKTAANVAVARLASQVASTAMYDARAGLLRAFHEASWTAQRERPLGLVQDLLTTHADRTAESVLALAVLVSSTCSVLTLLAFSIAVNPVGAAVALVGGSLLVSALRPLSRRSRRLAREHASAGRDYASAVAEGVSMARETRVFGVDHELTARTLAASRHQTERFRRARFLSQVLAPTYQSMAVAVLIGGVALVAAGDADDVGTLGAVLLLLLRAVSYGQQAQTAVQQVTERVGYLEALAAATDELRSTAAASGTVECTSVSGIDFADVGYSYGDKDVLRAVTASIRQGETIGIIGPSGSGKTTLLRVLLRLTPPTSGRVLVDGREIDVYTIASWTSQVAFVPQDPEILRATVAENIALFRPASRDQIEAAARAAYLDADIASFDDAYDTIVGPGGVALSGGQQQRLAIARALLVRPSLLVMDEPTSALDMRSEAGIQRTLQDLRGEITTIIVAHRLSTLNACDRILVLVDGCVEAFADHRALAEHSPYYAEAVRAAAVT